jgi:hypothetical protein
MENWEPIETAPKNRYFLACVTPERSEDKLTKAIFGDAHPSADRRHVIVARLRPKQRKGRVFMSVTGHTFWATHWAELPDLPTLPG